MDSNRLLRVVAQVALLSSTALSLQGTGARESFGDVRLTVVHAPQSPMQHTFAFSTPGLLGDAKQRAQFSHLVEHMVIRSTDPETLEVDGIQINGETTALSMRLDTYAQPDQWRAALARHLQWIQAEAFPADRLEIEKGRIASEEQSTVSAGATHKWADAAWAQVVLGGLGHAAVHGDVARATMEELHEAWQQRRGGWHLVTVGPVDPAEIRALVREALAGSEGSGEPAGVPAPGGGPAVLPSGNFEATWDLDAYHDIEWYALPDQAAPTRMAGLLATQVLNMQLMQSRELRELGVQVYVANDLHARGASGVKLSCSLAPDVDLEELREILDEAIATFAEGAAGRMAALRDQWRLELQMPFDLGLLREQMAARGAADELLEGRLVLGLMTQEALVGLPREEWDAVLHALEKEQLAAFVEQVFIEQRRSTLFLTPEKS